MNQDSQRILEEVLKLQEIMNNYFEAACAYKARLGLVLQTANSGQTVHSF